MTLLWQLSERNRRGAACHHTATHLLHKALKEVVGEHVNQAGSLVEPDRLPLTLLISVRCPKMSWTEWKLVNDAIRDNWQVTAEEMRLSEAEALGAIALFDEKYGDKVRVVSIDGYSKRALWWYPCEAYW